MRDRLNSRWVLAGALLVVGLLSIVRMGPWLLRDRPSVEANPSLGPYVTVSPVTLKPRSTACVSPAVISPRVRSLEWATSSADGQQLLATVRADGFIERANVPATSYGSANPAIRATIRRGPKTTVIGSVCLHNRGDRSIVLIGNSDPLGDVPAVSTLDGKQVADLQLTLYGEPRSFLAATRDVVTRVSALAGMPQWLVWLVGLSATILIPGLGVGSLIVRQRTSERISDGRAPASTTPPV